MCLASKISIISFPDFQISKHLPLTSNIQRNFAFINSQINKKEVRLLKLIKYCLQLLKLLKLDLSYSY